jgi:hypothetical protein
MFNRNGMSANYYLAGGSSLLGDIASGKPTVLMGRDPSNTSKAYSPFGPNNHYVVANGFDNSGRLLISDPEQSRVRAYDPNILRNVKVGVSGGASDYRTFGGVVMNTKTGESHQTKGYGDWQAKNGKAVGDGSTASYVFAYLVANGYSDGAACGIMANLQAESGMDPT